MNRWLALARLESFDHLSQFRGLAPGFQQLSDQCFLLNAALRSYAQQKGLVFLDYHTTMSNAQGGLDVELAGDGVHPSAKGYTLMAPLAEKAIAQALESR